MPLKLLTFNSAASEWINLSANVPQEMYGVQHISSVPSIYCASHVSVHRSADLLWRFDLSYAFKGKCTKVDCTFFFSFVVDL